MTSLLQQAQSLLFGKDGIGASNVKLFPGNDRDRTQDSVAGELYASLNRVMKGEAEEIQLDD